MTGLIRFLQNSVEEIHDSVRTYTTRTLIVPCQLCKRHVHIRVMDVLSQPDRSMDMECKHCSHIVCFTSGGRSPTNLAASRSFESHRSGQAIYSGSLPLGTQAIQSQVNSSRGYSPHDTASDAKHSVSGEPPAHPAPQSSAASKSRQSNPMRESGISLSNSRSLAPELYGNQDSASNDSLQEYFEDQDSTFGQSYSYRSSISIKQKPSLSHLNLMLGLEQCGDKPGAPQSPWNIALWHRADSPTPSTPPRFLSSSPVPSLSDERPLGRDDSSMFMELKKFEDRHTFQLSVGRRGSGDSRSSSIDLAPGKTESRAIVRRSIDSDQMQSSDLDSGDIRSGISEKRRGKMPMRSSTFHRAAVSRRHSLKIEQQEQHEAETLSAKRRNSMNTDFEVEPSDEEVRQAHKIWTELTQQKISHPESDIQWARVILRRRKNWENMRYDHPFKGGIELQQKSRNGVESAASASARPPGPVHQQLLPLTIPTSVPNMSPRISSFSLQALPTPVKEEPETFFGSLASESFVSVFRTPETASGVESGLPNPLGTALPILSRDERGDLTHQGSTGQASITSRSLSATIRQEPTSIRTRLRNNFRRLARRISCFESSHSLLSPHTQQPVNYVGPLPDLLPPARPSFPQQSQSSGEIQDVPTSNAPLVLVENAVIAQVGAMERPLFQFQFQARAEDLFPGVLR